MGGHTVVKITQLLGMLHEPWKKAKLSIEGALEATLRLWLFKVGFCEVFWEVAGTSYALIIPMPFSLGTTDNITW